MRKDLLITLDEFEESQEYWTEKLSGELVEAKIPGDFLRTDEYMAATHKIILEDNVVNKLIQISVDNNLSLFIILLTAFKILLFKLTGQNDIIVTSPIFSPSNLEFNKYVPLRDSIRPEMQFKDLLMKVRQTVVDGYKNEHFPMKKLIEFLEVKDSMLLSRYALLLKNIHQKDFINEVKKDLGNELTLSVEKNHKLLEGDLFYNQKLFKKETAKSLCDSYLHILRQVTDDTAFRLSDIELVSEEEKERILTHFNSSKGGYPEAKTLHGLFETQVEKTPDNIAVSSTIDLSDIIDGLESNKLTAPQYGKLKNCRFQKNRYIYQSDLNLGGNEGSFKILKTHRHNSVIVNQSMWKMINCFDGERNIGSVFSGIEEKKLRFLLCPLKSEDILEVVIRFGKKEEILLNGRFEDFVDVVKVLYDNHLIELQGFGIDGSKFKKPFQDQWEENEISDDKMLSDDLLEKDRKLHPAQVLFLGDTPGMPTTGLLYLTSYLRRNGIKAYCKFNDINMDPPSLRRRLELLLEEVNPHVVAISMKWFPYIARVFEVCKIVKDFSPNIKVVVGGNTASYYWQEVIQNEYVDFVIRGDGEGALLRICQGEKDLPNCVYKIDGKITANPITYMHEDSNSSEIYLSHLDEILISTVAPVFGSLFIYTHRGCEMNCIYCGGCKRAQEKSFNRSRLWNRPVEEVRKDIIEAKKYTSTFMFDFDASNKSLLAYLKKIWEGIDLSSHFCIYLNVIPPSPELIELVNSKFKYAYYDLDLASLSERHRNELFSAGLVKPQPSDQEIFNFLEECEKYDNNEVRINVINGLPYLNPEDIRQSEKTVFDIIKSYSCFGNLHWGRLHAQPGALILEDASKYGMYSMATTFEEFLKFSEMNFLSKSGFSNLGYPYIYFNDDPLNAEISRHYSEANIKLDQLKNDRKRKVLISEHVSYYELNNKANMLARMLRNKGIGRNTIVGIMIEPSSDLVTGILAILKAGGAYLPIDNDTPTNRLISYLHDSQALVLLTDSNTIQKISINTFFDDQLTDIKPHVTSPRGFIKEMDILPFPDRSLIDYEKYSQHLSMGIVNNGMTIQATRGCPFKCTYCFKIWSHRHNFRSADNVFEEIRKLYDIGIRRFLFIDSIFNLKIENSSRFFELVIKNGLKLNIFFTSGFRADILTKDFIDLAIEAGTVEMGMALETASPRMQKVIKKYLNLEKLSDIMDYVIEKYPQVLLELFILHGYPTETKEEAKMTMDFVKSKKWIDFPEINIVKIFKDTELERFALANGISKEAIDSTANLSFYDLPDTLPFEKSFTKSLQRDFMDNYMLCKERLLHKLPYQMEVYTEKELLQRYSDYFLIKFKSFSELLEFLNIPESELNTEGFLDNDWPVVSELNRKLRDTYPATPKNEDGLRILLLDLSQLFSIDEAAILWNVYEPPLGLMCLLTYLNQKLGGRVNGKIAKSRIDFDNYVELKALIDDFKPEIIGVRTLTFYRDFFHRSIAMIRHFGYEGPIIAGGPHATSYYPKVLQDQKIDLAVIGEGEITFCELIEKILDNGGRMPDDEILKQIPGLAFIPRDDRSEKKSTCEFLILDEQNSLFTEESVSNLENVSHSRDLANIIFTSGSTGKPNGVAVQHRGIVNYMLWRQDTYHFTENDVTLQPLSYCFDGYGSNFYSSILSGGCLVLIPYLKNLDFDYIKDLITHYGVTNSSLVPGMYQVLLDCTEKDELQSLRFVVLAGEKSGPKLIQMNREKASHILLHNEYGPTEASITAASNLNMDESNFNVVGRPISNTDLYILDASLKVLPQQIPGELYIAGPGISRGYINNPELTSERFIENPFLKGEYLYKTGDLARWLPGGMIEFIGRVDFQIKVRGYRIELGEIENKLLKYNKINKVAVIAREQEDGENYLYAYYVSEYELTEIELREYLSDELPDYMIPSHFIALDKMPLTQNGKIDRKALPDLGKVDIGDKYIAPGNRLEEALAEIWAEVLGMDTGKISMDANFFELGGHSLKATMLVSKIHKKLKVKLTVEELFKMPTIKQLSKRIYDSEEDEFILIEPASERAYYALSPIQKKVYILDQLNPEEMLFNVQTVKLLEGKVHKQRIEAALTRLIGRHESLRTTFETREGGELVQKILNEVDFRISYFDSLKKEVSQILEEFFIPFDLGQAPLFRVGLIKLDDEKHIMMVDMHHIISDGTSMGIFIREFSALYKGEELAPLKLQYKDYSEWQNSEKKMEALKRQEEYWLNEFSGEIPALCLPIDYKRPEIKSLKGQSIDFSLGQQETMKLEELALKEDATLFMTLLAVFNIFLSKVSGQDDIIVGTALEGRLHDDLREIIGVFANTLALRNYPKDEKTFLAFLRQVKESTLNAFNNQEYPFENLVEKILSKRDLSRNPLYDVMLVLQNIEMEPLEIEGVQILPYGHEDTIAKLDLSFTAVKNNGNITFVVEYCTQLFKEQTIERLIEYFIRTISLVVENPERRLSDIHITSQPKRSELLSENYVNLENE